MKRFVFSAALCLLAAGASAQKGNIGFVYPSGARKGTTVELTVGGQNLSKATGIVISGKGVTGELIPSPKGTKPKKRKKKNIGEEDNLQLADQVRFRISVAPDAQPGLRDLRLVMPGGMTNRLYFEIGELEDVCEAPREKLSGTSESLPVTFNGQIMRSDVDRFRFPAVEGEQLVLRVKARILVPYMADAVPGWFQPIIRLYAPDGKEVAYNDDYTFHVDPVLFYKVPASGNYEVEINDALYRGREDFVYRIDVGQLPFITAISPLGGPVGKKTAVSLKGYNLSDTKLTLKPREAGKIPVSIISRDGLSSNVMGFDATDECQIRTKKLAPNLSKASAWNLELGECVENVIGEPMQQHWYRFNVTGKRQSVHIAVTARHLGAPTDVRLSVFDDNGRKVFDVDDTEDEDDYMTTHFADPELTKPFTPGCYYIRVIESQGCGGPDFRYRLYLSKSSPDFSLHLEPATFSVPENGTGLFNVILNRKQNFNGPVEINVAGLPEGFKVSGNAITARQKKTLVTVTAPKGAAHGALNPEVSGTASKGGVEITRPAVPAETMMQAFYYTHLMPMDEFRMEVGPEQPFRMEVVNTWGERLALERGKEIAVRVRIERKPDFKSPVTLMLKSSVQGVKAEAVVIPENESEGVLMVTMNAGRKNKKEIIATLAVSGVVKGTSKKIAGKSRNAFIAAVTAYAPAFEAVLPPL